MQGFETVDYCVRPLTEQDRGLFVSIHTDADVMRHVGPAMAPAGAEAVFMRALSLTRDRDRPGAYWVVRARNGDRAVGLLGLVPEGSVGRVGALLLKEWQGRGVAAQVIPELGRQVARNSGLERLCIEYRQCHSQAPGLMRKLGYTPAASDACPEGLAQWWFDLPPIA